MIESGAIARFGGIEAYGDTFRGTGWHFTDLIGYTEAPDVVRDRIKRVRAAGTHRTPAYLDERVVRIPGFLVASDHRDLEDKAEQFRGLITQEIPLSIETVRGSTWVRGTVTRASFVNQTFAPEGQWVLELTCDDPRKFGKVRPFTSGQAAYHRGNISAHPLIKVTGPRAPYTVTAGANQFIVTTALPGGSVDVIDTSEGWVLRDGVHLIGGVSRADTWTVPPGMPGLVHTITIGDMQVLVTDSSV